MRLSTNMIFNQQVRGITDSQASWLKVGEQLSTGRQVNNPSDDPIAASRAVVLSQSQSKSSQYAMARSFANQSLSMEENSLTSVTTSITAAQQIVVAASTGTLNDEDRASYATQLQGIRDQILSQANSKDGTGRYIFAGYKTDVAPFSDAAGGVTYVGGAEAISQKIDDSRTIAVGDAGNAVFMSLTSNAKAEPDGTDSEKSLFNMLDSAIAALKVPQEGADASTTEAFSDVMAKTNRGLSNSLNNVLKVRSDLGTKMAELDTLDTQGDDRDLIMSSQMSDLVDVDYTQAISSYTMKQTALQASYKTFTDMSQMSLFQLNS
ncbi:flagellar hook-associated protein FlgL [Pantoea sp. GM01]|uniref:flagellar hook-associated protein FlgL n=1 Tax=Pantoea sp. GM01 TaxID=1144320 RepID=UPI000271072A|nr:flagellar hook-associated protein FlgL [Pantoea sp. GM01]EJL92946.1 flagellar hook-associated protein 3 [Pantoea sp. GM01]